MPPLGRRVRRPRTAAQFAAGRAAAGRGGVPLTGVKPGIQSQINQGRIAFNPVSNLGYTPVGVRPGTVQSGRIGPGGVWSGTARNPYGLTEDYQVGGGIQDLLDQGILRHEDLGGLGYVRNPINIRGQAGLDLASGVASDWELAAAQADIGRANAADAAAARENIEALATQWGGDLSGLVKQGLISQATAEAASKNQFSTMAQLQQALKMGTGQSRARLAARGILNSGGVAAGSTALNRDYQRESTTGLQALMGNIKGIKSQQAQAAAERQMMLANVRAGIAARLSADPRYQGTPDMQATWDSSVGAYVDDWGRRWDQQGNRLS